MNNNFPYLYKESAKRFLQKHIKKEQIEHERFCTLKGTTYNLQSQLALHVLQGYYELIQCLKNAKKYKHITVFYYSGNTD